MAGKDTQNVTAVAPGPLTLLPRNHANSKFSIDSTRRSGRATKGQHSKLQEEEVAAPAPPKRANSTKKSKKNEPTPPPEEDETEAIIRCICGYVEEDEDEERKMICCEECEAWQHNECMEMSENDDELPDKYYCEQCRPKNHKELLAQIARGEKPWEERARQREEEEAQKKSRKKKGKKGGRKGRPSEIQREDSQENGAMDTTIDSTMDTTMDPAPELVEAEHPAEVVQPSIEVESNNKRKLPEEGVPEAQSPSQIVRTESSQPSFNTNQDQEPPHKTRKTSAPATEKPSLPQPARRKSGAPAASKRDSTGIQLQTELVENISDLQSDDRKRVAGAVVKMFVSQTKEALKDGTFHLPAGQKADAFGLRLGLAVEYAVYLNFWGQAGKPSQQYSDKFRAILHNVKANKQLRNDLLNGSLSPNDFSKMSSNEMATKELQDKRAEMLKETEKQHVLIQEEGPRLRRTHKGEEVIEDDSHMADTTDSGFTAPAMRKRPSEIDTSIKQGSPEAPTPQSPAAVELPETFGAGSPTTNQPLTVDTSALPRASAGPERKSSNNFNIQDVWSGVKGPDPGARQVSRPSESAITPIQQTPGPGVQADAEIDQLLKDEEPEDEEPYSPAEYTSEPGAPIWHGKMSMAGIASFNGIGKYVAGADLSSGLPWHTLVPATLTIEGRIDIDRASEYLCGLRWSNTTDVVVVSVTPSEDPDNVAQFDKLFRYFTERKRYGVVGKSTVPAVKDTYIVPLDAGMSKKAEFVELLEYCIIEDPTPERMLLLTFVVKLNNSPSAQQTPRPLDANSMASPIGPNHSAITMGSHPGLQHLPAPGVPPNAPLPPHHHHQGYSNSPNHQTQTAYMPPHQSPYPVTGRDAARQVLGEWADAPVVSELLAEAPNSGVAEFEVIRAMFESVPATRTDLNVLKQMLEIRHQQAQQADMNGVSQ